MFLKKIKKILKQFKMNFNTQKLDTRKMSQGQREMLLRIICR